MQITGLSGTGMDCRALGRVPDSVEQRGGGRKIAKSYEDPEVQRGKSKSIQKLVRSDIKMPDTTALYKESFRAGNGSYRDACTGRTKYYERERLVPSLKNRFLLDAQV